MTAKVRPALRLNALTVALMNRAMLDGPSTIYDLMDACGLQRGSVHRYLTAMKQNEVIFIAQWEQDNLGRFVIPAFSLGVGKDAAKPKSRVSARRRERKARAAQVVMNHMMAGDAAGL